MGISKENSTNTEAREKVLQAAERLFSEKGFASVTLRDIAAEIGIKHTSLYHHVPGGKEEMFIEVTERTLKRHRDGLSNAIRSAGTDIREQLRGAAYWLLSQPPMDLVRMVYSDMPSIDDHEAERLSHLAYQSMLMPLVDALKAAQSNGQIAHPNPMLIAGALIGMVESLHAAPSQYVQQSQHSMADEMIDIMLDGIRSHPS